MSIEERILNKIDESLKSGEIGDDPVSKVVSTFESAGFTVTKCDENDYSAENSSGVIVEFCVSEDLCNVVVMIGEKSESFEIGKTEAMIEYANVIPSKQDPDPVRRLQSMLLLDDYVLIKIVDKSYEILNTDIELEIDQTIGQCKILASGVEIDVYDLQSTDSIVSAIRMQASGLAAIAVAAVDPANERLEYNMAGFSQSAIRVATIVKERGLVMIKDLFDDPTNARYMIIRRHAGAGVRQLYIIIDEVHGTITVDPDNTSSPNLTTSEDGLNQAIDLIMLYFGMNDDSK